MDERERLIEIMKSQELNSKQLSQALGVSAGTISNILGGRNKPSLEFLQNVANHFPFISPTWLFLGFGEKYIEGYVPSNTQEQNLFAPAESSDAVPLQTTSLHNNASRAIQKILIFYTDGTFEES